MSLLVTIDTDPQFAPKPGLPLPERLIACADLEAPTNHKRGLTAFTADDHAGTYLHCGVREHVMGALANGLRVVRTGLTPDDRVIINGLQRARPGQKVTAQNGTIKAEETKADAPVTTAPVASSATFVASAG